MWLGAIFALALLPQELVIERGEARAVSPLTTTYAGRCASGPFEIAIRRETPVGEANNFHLTVTRGGASTNLSDTMVTADLSGEGAFVNSGFACGVENVTWYIWVVRLSPDKEPAYLRGQAVLGPHGQLVSYTGLHPEEPGMLALAAQ